MEEFREQAPIQEAQKDDGKEKIDVMMPFLEGETRMYNDASSKIESKTDEVKKEGLIRKMQKFVAGGVGFTILAGSIAMGVPSAYGGERSKGKTSTEHIEKAPKKESSEKKETKEDEKNPLYEAGALLAVEEFGSAIARNEKPSLSTYKLGKYLRVSPIFLQGYLDKWGSLQETFNEENTEK